VEGGVRGESRLIAGAFRAGAVALVPAAGIAWVLRGGPGALAVLIALAIVVANIAVSGLVLMIASRRAPENYPMIAMPSYALRMVAVFAAMAAAHATSAIDQGTFAITFALAVVVILAYECFLWARTPWLALEFGKERP
jgi:hypothetical protein